MGKKYNNHEFIENKIKNSIHFLYKIHLKTHSAS